jgi:hypothetical protein
VTARRRVQRWVRRRPLTALLVVGVLLLISGGVFADVILLYSASTRVTSTTSPFGFVNGGNYAVANAEGFVTNAYPNAQQVSVATTVSGAAGAYGTYALDVLRVDANVGSAQRWVLHLDVVSTLIATGVNAAYLFYCTQAPTGVPDTGVPLASGVDANGNPWAIFAPTCAGTEVGESLLTVATGTGVSFPGTTAGSSLLYLSFGVAVTNTGASTATPATVILSSTSP